MRAKICLNKLAHLQSFGITIGTRSPKVSRKSSTRELLLTKYPQNLVLGWSGLVLPRMLTG